MTPGSRGIVARHAIKQAGGLMNMTQLARRYGLPKSTMHKFCARADFPEAVHDTSNAKVYLAVEVDEWMRFAGKRP